MADLIQLYKFQDLCKVKTDYILRHVYWYEKIF